MPSICNIQPGEHKKRVIRGSHAPKSLVDGLESPRTSCCPNGSVSKGLVYIFRSTSCHVLSMLCALTFAGLLWICKQMNCCGWRLLCGVLCTAARYQTAMGVQCSNVLDICIHSSRLQLPAIDCVHSLKLTVSCSIFMMA